MKRFLLYCFTYIIITLSVAFGTVAIDNLTTKGSTGSSNILAETSSTPGNKLINNLMSLGKAEVEIDVLIYDKNSNSNNEQVVKTNLYSNNEKTITYDNKELAPTIDINFYGNINIASLEDIKLNGNLNVKLTDTELNFFIAYFDNCIYLSNETLNIKLETDSISKVFELLPYLGLNLDIGLDLENLNLDEVLGMLENIKETKIDESNLKLSLNLFGFNLDIICDNEYNVKKIEARELEVDNNIICINAGLNKNESLEFTNPEDDIEKEYVDVTKTLNIVDSVKEILENKKLHLVVDASLVDSLDSIILTGDVDIDFLNKISVYANLKLQLNDAIHTLKIGYINSNIYVEFNDIKFMVENETLEQTIKVITENFDIKGMEENMLLAISNLIPNFELSKILNGNFSDININNLLEFSSGIDNVINITVFGTSLGISEDINLTLVLDENDQFESITLKGISVLNKTLSASIRYSNKVEIPTLNDSDYLNFNNLPNLVDAILKTVSSIKEEKEVSLNLNCGVVINNTNVNLNGQINVNFKEENNLKVYANLNLIVLNKTINLQVYYLNNEIYLSVDNLKFTARVDELNDLINIVNVEFKDSEVAEILVGVINSFSSNSKIMEIVKGNLNAITADLIKEINIENKIAYIVLDKSLINASSDIKLDINFENTICGVELETLTFGNVAINANVNLTSNIVVPTLNKEEYSSLKYAKNLVVAVLNSADEIIAQKQIALSLNANVVYKNLNIQLTGDVALSKEQIYVNLNVVLNDRTIKVEAYIVGDNIYLGLDDLFVYTKLSNISKLVSLFDVDSSNVANVLQQILPKFNFEQILNKDLSSISLSIIKDISILENSAKIVLSNEYINTDKDINVTLNYNNKLTTLEISKFSILNVKLNASASILGEYEIKELDASKYNDLSNLYESASAILNTVNNVIKNKEIAFNVNLNLTNGQNKYGVKGNLYVNFKNAITKTVEETKDNGEVIKTEKTTFNACGLVAYANITLNISGTNYNVKLNVENGYVYAEFKELKVKMEINSIMDIVSVVTNLLPKDENSLDLNSILNTYFANSVVLDIVNGNYSNISLSLIKAITTSKNALYITLDKTLINSNNDIIVSISYKDNLIYLINLLNIKVQNIGVTMNAELNYNFTYNSVNDAEYFDISGAPSLINSALNTINNVKENKQIGLTLNNSVIYLENKNIYINGNIYVDFTNAISENENGESKFNLSGLVVYANLVVQTYNLQTKTFDDYTHNISALFDGKTIYVKYNTLKVSISVDSITSIVDVVNEIINLNKEDAEKKNLLSDFDVNKILNDIFPNINFEKLLAGDISSLNLKLIKYLNIGNTKTEITLDKNVLGTASDIGLVLNYENQLNGVSLSGLSYKEFTIDLNLALENDFVIPEINAAEYTNLDSASDFANSVLNTAKTISNNKNIAFNLNTTIVIENNTLDDNDVITKSNTTEITLLNSSYAKFDWNNAFDIVQEITQDENGEEQVVEKQVFNVEKLSIYANLDLVVKTIDTNYVNGVKDENSAKTVTTNYKVTIAYINNVVYLTLNQMKVKLSGEGIGLTVDSLCELFGLNVGTDSFNNFIGLIGSMGSDSSLLDKLQIEMIKGLTLTSNKFGAELDLSNLGLGLPEDLTTLNLELVYNAESIEYVTIKNLNIKQAKINAINIGLQPFTQIENVVDEGFIDLSSVGELIDAIKNTIKFKDFSITGNVNLKVNVIGINIDMNIPLAVDLKVLNKGFEAKAVIGPIPVIGGVNDDAPYEAGNTVSGANPSKNRILTIYIKDNMVYMHRSEQVPFFASKDKIYEKKLKVHMDTLFSDPLYYLMQYGMGFSQKIMDALTGSLGGERTNPLDISNVLKDYTKQGNLCTLTLNLAELLDNNKLDTMSVGVRIVEYTKDNISQNVVGGLTLNMFMPVASGVEITLSSNDITLNNIGGTVNLSDMHSYISTYNYKEGAEWDAYNSDWKLSSQRKFVVSFVTNSSDVIASVEGVAGSRLVLPTLDSYYIDNGETRTTYEFAGWYTTKTFDVGSEYTLDIMPRTSTTLYAKWNTTIDKYITISFVTNGGESLDSIKVLEGTKLNLPVYLDLLIIETNDSIISKQFDGWYVDEDCLTLFNSEYAPNINLTLYAKWTVVNMAETHELTIYDNGEKITTKRLFANQTISLSGSKFNDTTKYYLDSTYLNEFTSMVMPDSNLDLHIRNAYSLTIVSDYGNVINSKVNYLQGNAINLNAQSSYFEDDGTETERVIYTFNGYYINGVKIDNLNNVVMPNENTTIVANWTREVKLYFTVTFDVSFKAPGSWNVDSGAWGTMTCVTAANKVNSIKLLEGTEFNPDPSVYSSSCSYAYKAVGISKTRHFKLVSWNLDSPKQLSYNKLATSATTEKHTTLTNVTITDDITLYAVWAEK